MGWTPDTGWWTRDCLAPRHRCTRPLSSLFSAAPPIRARRVPCSRVAPGRGDRARVCLLRRAGSPGARWRRRRRRGDPRRREATSRERGRRSLTAPPRRSLWRRGVALVPHWHKASGLTHPVSRRRRIGHRPSSARGLRRDCPISSATSQIEVGPAGACMFGWHPCPPRRAPALPHGPTSTLVAAIASSTLCGDCKRREQAGGRGGDERTSGHRRPKLDTNTRPESHVPA